MPHAEELPSLADHIGPPPGPSAATGTPAERFPEAHRALLGRFNGFTVHHGAFRLFGIGRRDALDLAAWNAYDTWRFAWDDRIDDFVIFGETRPIITPGLDENSGATTSTTFSLTVG